MRVRQKGRRCIRTQLQHVRKLCQIMHISVCVCVSTMLLEMWRCLDVVAFAGLLEEQVAGADLAVDHHAHSQHADLAMVDRVDERRKRIRISVGIFVLRNANKNHTQKQRRQGYGWQLLFSIRTITWKAKSNILLYTNPEMTTLYVITEGSLPPIANKTQEVQ